MRFKAHAGTVLWAEGEVCVTCEAPLTHFVATLIENTDHRIRVIYKPYCNRCSPAIDQSSLLPSESVAPAPIVLPERPGWLERWVTRWILTTADERARHAA